jgi:hypothetical protein
MADYPMVQGEMSGPSFTHEALTCRYREEMTELVLMYTPSPAKCFNARAVHPPLFGRMALRCFIPVWVEVSGYTRHMKITNDRTLDV